MVNAFLEAEVEARCRGWELHLESFQLEVLINNSCAKAAIYSGAQQYCLSQDFATDMSTASDLMMKLDFFFFFFGKQCSYFSNPV